MLIVVLLDILTSNISFLPANIRSFSESSKKIGGKML